MWKIKETKLQRIYKGYEYRREIIDDSEYGGNGKLEMVNCYTTNGDWIGDSRQARFLCKKMGLTYIQKTEPDHCVCSIGYNPDKKKWFGWSHRAICGFGIGDYIFEEEYGDEKTLFTKHGSEIAKTLKDAKKAASNFAKSVS